MSFYNAKGYVLHCNIPSFTGHYIPFSYHHNTYYIRPSYNIYFTLQYFDFVV